MPLWLIVLGGYAVYCLGHDAYYRALGYDSLDD